MEEKLPGKKSKGANVRNVIETEEVFVNSAGEKYDQLKFNDVRITPLTKPTLKRPVYYQKDTRIIINPSTINKINIAYIRKLSASYFSFYFYGSPGAGLGYRTTFNKILSQSRYSSFNASCPAATHGPWHRSCRKNVFFCGHFNDCS